MTIDVGGDWIKNDSSTIGGSEGFNWKGIDSSDGKEEI